MKLVCLLDVHPSSVCQKLGPKYASIPGSKLGRCDDLYKDLLRYLHLLKFNLFLVGVAF